MAMSSQIPRTEKCYQKTTEPEVYFGFPLAAKKSFRHGLQRYMMSRTCSSSGCPCCSVTEKSFGYRCHHWSETLTRRKRHHKSKSGDRFIGWLTGMVHLRSANPWEAAAKTHGPHNKCNERPDENLVERGVGISRVAYMTCSNLTIFCHDMSTRQTDEHLCDPAPTGEV